MRFTVDPRIFSIFPELRLGVIVASQIDNRGTDEGILGLLRSSDTRVRNRLSLDNLSEIPLIANWRAAYKTLRIKDGRPSHAALIRRVLKGDEIPHINKLVDTYNAISLEYLTPFGGEALEKTRGDLALRYASGSEEFVQLGSTEVTHPNEGEIIYSDQEKVLCRKFNRRESELTKLTEETTTAFFVTEILPAFEEVNVDRALGDFAKYLSRYCKARTQTFILDANRLEISW